jgi:hypothetical protein
VVNAAPADFNGQGLGGPLLRAEKPGQDLRLLVDFAV